MTARRPGAEALADISAQRFVVQLEYLRQAAAGLRAPDPVPPELAQVARWSERPELVRAWLWAADALERGESDVDGVRRALCAGWDGPGSERFTGRLSRIGRARGVRRTAAALRDGAFDLHRLGVGIRRLLSRAAADVRLALRGPEAGPEPARDRLVALRRAAVESTGELERILASLDACCGRAHEPAAHDEPTIPVQPRALPAHPPARAVRGGAQETRRFPDLRRNSAHL